MLVFRLASTESHRVGQEGGCEDVHMINMDHVQDVRVLKSAGDEDTAHNVGSGGGGGGGGNAALSYVDLTRVSYSSTTLPL